MPSWFDFWLIVLCKMLPYKMRFGNTFCGFLILQFAEIRPFFGNCKCFIMYVTMLLMYVNMLWFGFIVLCKMHPYKMRFGNTFCGFLILQFAEIRPFFGNCKCFIMYVTMLLMYVNMLWFGFIVLCKMHPYKMRFGNKFCGFLILQFAESRPFWRVLNFAIPNFNV